MTASASVHVLPRDVWHDQMDGSKAERQYGIRLLCIWELVKPFAQRQPTHVKPLPPFFFCSNSVRGNKKKGSLARHATRKTKTTFLFLRNISSRKAVQLAQVVPRQDY